MTECNSERTKLWIEKRLLLYFDICAALLRSYCRYLVGESLWYKISSHMAPAGLARMRISYAVRFVERFTIYALLKRDSTYF